MMEIGVAPRTHLKAYANYLTGIGSNLTIDDHSPETELGFCKFIGLSDYQARRYFRFVGLSVPWGVAHRIELLAKPHGWALLRAYDIKHDVS